jgi:hypothetical protein
MLMLLVGSGEERSLVLGDLSFGCRFIDWQLSLPKPAPRVLTNAEIGTDAESVGRMAGEMIIYMGEDGRYDNRHFQTGTCFILKRNSN